MITTGEIVWGCVIVGLAFVCLAGDAWAFLTPEERGKVVWWMFVSKRVPLWVVESDAFAHLFAKYAGKSLFPLEPDLFSEMTEAE